MDHRDNYERIAALTAGLSVGTLIPKSLLDELLAPPRSKNNDPLADRADDAIAADIASLTKLRGVAASIASLTKLIDNLPRWKPKRKRQPTLASVAKQASKAGVEVARYEVEPDGKIVVVPGQPTADQTNDLDKWMAKRHAN